MGIYELKANDHVLFQTLNTRWATLQQVTADRAQTLGSAHEVQRFHRDVDETKDWIHEKNQALNNDNYGHDLASVQALQRKHEGLERDLAALGEKVGASMCLMVFLCHQPICQTVWMYFMGLVGKLQ